MAPAEVNAHRILVVEDRPSIGSMLETLLAGQGYQVVRAENGVQALVRLTEKTPDLIFLDLDLPRLNGSEICKRLKRAPATRLVPVIVFTGQDPCEGRLQAWEMGADEFLSKPVQNTELLACCQSQLRVKRLTDELETAQAVMFAFARAVEAKSAYTQGHSQRVAHYAVLLAEQIGLPKREQDLLWNGSLLHDVGKISIPDAILNKPGILTPDEFEAVKKHPAQGERIVEPLKSLHNILPMIRWHHERLDGKGYPDGLSGDQIPLLVRIVSVADVYDSLASMRPYRTAMSSEVCLQMMQSNAAAGGLDPELVEQFAVMLLDGRVLPDNSAPETLLLSDNEGEVLAETEIMNGPNQRFFGKGPRFLKPTKRPLTIGT